MHLGGEYETRTLIRSPDQPFAILLQGEINIKLVSRLDRISHER